MPKSTDVTPTQLRDSAKAHRDTNDAFKRSENKVSDTIDFLNQTNKGDLMNRLKEVHAEWKEAMEKAQGTLDTLAEYMDTSANKLEALTSGHAGDLR